jgi:formiminoglutamase
MVRRSNWGLLGLADDLGVYNVGGRVGASGAPAAVRKHLTKMTGEPLSGGVEVLGALTDFGDWTPAPTHSLDPDVLGAQVAVERMIAQVGVSVVIGGGNDLAFAQLKAVQRTLGSKRLGCINIDAHFDLRPPAPRISSGSPFYLALEQGVLAPSRFVEFGIQSHCNAPELWAYARRKKLRIITWDQLRGRSVMTIFQRELSALAKKCDHVVICIDLDAIAQAYAPGVSAPQSEGFTPMEIVSIAQVAAQQLKVVSLGVFELNPEHDENRKTARLAATLIWNFARTRLSRGGAKQRA